MKQKIVFLGVAIVLMAGCKKNDSPKPLFPGSIEGTWELRQTSAITNSPNVSVLPPGNGHILKFGDTDYEKYEAGQLVKKGEYAIVPDPTVESSVCLLFPIDQFTHRIVYDNDNNSEKQFMQFIGNRLVIEAGCYASDGGHRMEYEKVEN